jgi:hypothetical protein
MNERKRAAADECDDEPTSSPPSLKELKSSMRLDLNSKETSLKKQLLSLTTPDVIQRIVMLASPEFNEKLLCPNFNSVATSTPTPTKLLYPSEVTALQREYAQGFIDALNHVQQCNGYVPSAAAGNLLSPGFLTPFVSAAAVAAVAAAAATATATATATSLAAESKSSTQTTATSPITVPSVLLVQSPTTATDPVQVAAIMQEMQNNLQHATFNRQHAALMSAPHPLLVPSSASYVIQNNGAIVSSTSGSSNNNSNNSNSVSLPNALSTLSVKRPQLTCTTSTSMFGVDDRKDASSTTFELTTLNPPTPTSTALPGTIDYLEPSSPASTSSSTASSPSSSTPSTTLASNTFQGVDLSLTSSQASAVATPAFTSSSSTSRRASVLLTNRLRNADESSVTSNPSSTNSSTYAIGANAAFDMTDQDRMKLERKRARNRAAATKCRQRKMDKISELENDVRDQQDRSKAIKEMEETLSIEIARLKQLVNTHRTRGCDLKAK